MDTRAVSGRKGVERRMAASALFRLPIMVAVLTLVWSWLPAEAHAAFRTPQSRTNRAVQSNDARAEAELQTGISLTRRGKFEEAIPHFLAVQGHVSIKNEFVLEYDLALCYVATGRFEQRHVGDLIHHNPSSIRQWPRGAQYNQ